MATPEKPPWLKVSLPGGERYREVRRAVIDGDLHTVCREARCPNMGECWSSGTATFLVLGDTCTRGCRFCAVGRGDPGGIVDRDEPRRVADAARSMGLDHAVVTSVTRDDLPDGGAEIFAATVRSLRRLDPPPTVEILIPDYLGGSLDTVLEAAPDVLAHNVEVVERLTPSLRHARFSYRRSLEVLERTARSGRSIVKSSLILGLGETDAEIDAAMSDLREVGVEILMLGQYLRPTSNHATVKEYLPPERFEELGDRGREMGFGFVSAGPLVRTSYRAAEAYARQRALSAGG